MSKEINRIEKISRGMRELYMLNCKIQDLQKKLNKSDISKIEITNEEIIFTIDPLNIKIMTDCSARAVPLEILHFGRYEDEELKMIYKLVSNNSIILDVGAHLGWYSINFAKKLPFAKIYSFEPVKNTYKALKKNLELNEIKNVTALNFGLYNEEAKKDFYLFSEGTTFASMENIVDHPDAQKISCSVKRLDDLIHALNIDHIDFIKCDVEGAELMVLEGAIKAIETFCPIFLLEIATLWCDKFNYVPNDILIFMCCRGYLCFILDDGLLLQQNEIKLDRKNYNNYFFLHQNKQKHLIENLRKK